MPRFRRSVNRAVAEFGKAKKANTTQYAPGRFSLLDREGMNREVNAQEKLQKLIKLRKSAPLGVVRKLLSPKAYSNLIKLREYTKNKNRPDLVKVNPLLEGHRIGDTVVTISKRGNLRKGKILGASSEFIRIRGKKGEVVLRLRQLRKVSSYNPFKK
ncbi:MAG: hypothetical protein WC821_02190 [archaeon]|jgi:hypothetical protein